MSPPTPSILDTVTGHLAPLFLHAANGDPGAARDAARYSLQAHDPRTDEERSLAAEIVSFSFHALEALGAAAAPDLSLSQKLRLRGSAVSLSREAHKARRRLDQLRRARQSAPIHSETAQAAPQAPSLPPESPPPESPPLAAQKVQQDHAADQALGLIEFARQALAGGSVKGGFQAWTKSQKKRLAAERIAENSRRHKAEHERRQAAAAEPRAGAMPPAPQPLACQ